MLSKFHQERTRRDERAVFLGRLIIGSKEIVKFFAK